MKNIKHSIALLELNLMHHKSEIRKFKNSPLMIEYLKGHKKLVKDLNSALKLLKK